MPRVVYMAQCRCNEGLIHEFGSQEARGNWTQDHVQDEPGYHMVVKWEESR